MYLNRGGGVNLNVGSDGAQNNRSRNILQPIQQNVSPMSIQIPFQNSNQNIKPPQVSNLPMEIRIVGQMPLILNDATSTTKGENDSRSENIAQNQEVPPTSAVLIKQNGNFYWLVQSNASTSTPVITGQGPTQPNFNPKPELPKLSLENVGSLARIIPPKVDIDGGNTIYVNPKQYFRILKRREARERLSNRISKTKPKYLHKSRHDHAMKRIRGHGGRFLSVGTKKASGKTSKSENRQEVNEMNNLSCSSSTTSSSQNTSESWESSVGLSQDMIFYNFGDTEISSITNS